jgi:lysophospholipase L1-like esterase
MEEGERANGKDITTRINSHGLRGDEPVLPRPAERQRILTLGDSSFFGFLVSDENVFTHYLARILRDKGINVDVINAGVAGYSIAQHKLFMDEQGWDLEPTLIVYCNLWSDNTWDTFRDEDLLAARRFAQFNPLVHSAAMRLLAAKLSRPETEEGGRIIMWRGEKGWPEGKIRRVPLSRFIALHDGLVREAASRGIGGAYVIPTNSFMLSGDIDTSTPPSWDPYFQAFRLLGEHHSQPVVDVGEVFQEQIKAGMEVENLLIDLMHPSKEGHRRMAEALADALIATGWPDNPLLGQVSSAVDPYAIEDHPPPVWTDDDGAGSSQRYLFDISEEEQRAIRKRAKAMAEAGPPRPEAPSGAQDPRPSDDDNIVSHADVPMARPPPGGGWPVLISVQGGRATYKLVVRDPDGRPVGSARMMQPATIRLMMRVDLDELTVEVTDSSGQLVTSPLSRDSPSITIKLED